MKIQSRADVRQDLLKAAAGVDLPAEVRLDPSIVPATGAVAHRPSRVLVTGATGFLGAFLVARLLREPGLHVECLVRAPSAERGLSRLQGVLQSFQLWDQAHASRLHVLAGDLGRPRLGLSTAEFERLTEEVDAVYHVGAVVNLVFPYTLLKPANVLGTQEVIRLAAQKRPKWLHYVSTNGFFLAPEYAGRAVSESDPASSTEHLGHGYLQTKWVAEKLVWLARERGLLTTIHRPTFIGWHSQSGVHNDHDFMCGLIDGSLALGSAPELDLLVELAPVDYVAEAIWHLSQTAEPGLAFNVGNPQRVPWEQVVQLLQHAGQELRREPYAVWHARVLAQRENPAYAFRTMLPEPGAPRGDSVGEALSSQRFPRLGFEQIHAGLSGSNIRCPALDVDLLNAHLEYLRRRSTEAAGARSFARWATS